MTIERLQKIESKILNLMDHLRFVDKSIEGLIKQRGDLAEQIQKLENDKTRLMGK